MAIYLPSVMNINAFLLTSRLLKKNKPFDRGFPSNMIKPVIAQPNSFGHSNTPPPMNLTAH